MSIDLKQLSAHLQLSPTTVSRALNGYPDVSERTRERVMEAARLLDYQPNMGARRLATGRAEAIGIVYPLEAGDLGDPRFLEVVEGISDRLDDANIELLLVSAREKSELQSYQRLVKSRRVDGLIVSRTRVIDPRIEYLLSSGMPFVAHGRSESLTDFPWFDFDNQAGIELAVQALLKLGHRKIAYVHAPMSLNFALQRYLGFEKTMQAAGINDYSKYVYLAGMNRRSGYEVVQRILNANPRPTAIVVDNNLCGVGIARGLIDSQITIGKDISVVIYDGVPVDTLLPGHLIASVEQPTAYDAGQKMADMLLTLIKGEPLEERHVLWQPEFVAANSIGAAP